MTEVVYFWTVTCLSVAWITTVMLLLSACRFFHFKLSVIEDRVRILDGKIERRGTQ